MSNKQAQVDAGKTAIARRKPSAPLELLERGGCIRGRVLDYGCGKGADVSYLEDLGYDISGYDPNHRPDVPNGLFDTITCTYVLNVIENEVARQRVINQIYRKLKKGGVAFISVRRDKKALTGWKSGGTWQGDVYPELDSFAFKSNKYQIYVLKKESVV